MGCDRTKKQTNSSTIHLQGRRNMFVAERFIGGLVKRHGQHPISTDGGIWYPQACKFLKLESSYPFSFLRKV